MLPALLYILTRRMLELVALRFRSGRSKELEIVVLRHELAILRRQVARPELADADRVFLAAASQGAAPTALADVLRATRDAAALAPSSHSPGAGRIRGGVAAARRSIRRLPR